MSRLGGRPPGDSIVDRAAAFPSILADICLVKDVVVRDYHFAFHQRHMEPTFAQCQRRDLY